MYGELIDGRGNNVLGGAVDDVSHCSHGRHYMGEGSG